MLMSFTFMGEKYVVWYYLCPLHGIEPIVDTREEFIECLYASA